MKTGELVFSNTRRCWYGPQSLALTKSYVDEVIIGCQSKGGGVHWECAMRWFDLHHGSKPPSPRLDMFSDSWAALAEPKFAMFINTLHEHANTEPTPEDICTILQECGFTDKTREINEQAGDDAKEEAESRQKFLDAKATYLKLKHRFEPDPGH